jgi:hypothetical protein
LRPGSAVRCRYEYGGRVLKRHFGIAAISLLAFGADASAAQPQRFVDMNAQVEGFLTGLWVRTAAPADRPPTEAEMNAAVARCTESMIDPRNEDKGARAIFPNDNASRGDVSMFRSEGVFVLVERMQKPNGIRYPEPKRMSVGAVQQQNRITVRFVSRGRWLNGAWSEEIGRPVLWGDAMLGDLDIGGANKHVFVLGKDNNQTTYVKCES